MDLFIWIILVLVFELIATFATTRWFDQQAVAISITLAMTCAVMVRWGWRAAAIAVAGGAAFSFASGASAEQYAIYCVGNAFALVGLLVIKWLGEERIRQKFFEKMIYVIVSYIGVALGRWLVSLLFGGEIMTFVVYLTTDVISLVFAVVIAHILSKCDGMLENQKTYLFRLERERKENEGCPETDEIIL